MTDTISLLTALLTLAAVLLSLRKSYQAVGKIEANAKKIQEISQAADGARLSLHNHLAMIEAGVAAAAEASAKQHTS